MFDLSLPWWEFMARAAIVYAFLLITLRVIGKRQFGELSPFDLILLLIISNAVQNSMNGGDDSVTGGLILAGTLMFIDYVLGIITFNFKKAGALIEGKPQVIIYNGQIDTKITRRQRLGEEDIKAALRQEGVSSLSEVKMAVLENDGSISVIKNKSPVS